MELSTKINISICPSSLNCVQQQHKVFAPSYMRLLSKHSALAVLRCRLAYLLCTGAPAVFADLVGFQKKAKKYQCGCLGVGTAVAFQPNAMVSWYRRLHDLCDFRVDAVAGIWIFRWSSRHAKIWVGMQEHTESTHEVEEIPTQKDTRRAAFEEDCSPAGSPRPLLPKLLEKQSFGIGHLFLGSLFAVQAKFAKNALYATWKQHERLIPLLRQWKRFGRGSQKSDQILNRLYTHPHWRSAQKTKFWDIKMNVRNDLRKPGPPNRTEVASNGRLLVGHCTHHCDCKSHPYAIYASHGSRWNIVDFLVLSTSIKFHRLPLSIFWSLAPNLCFIRRCVARMSYVRTKLQITRNRHIPPPPPPFRYVTPKCISRPEERTGSGSL